MKRIIVPLAALMILLGGLEILKADETPTPSDFRSYTQGFTPQLGGVYRNPDAYLPYYPGYAPIGNRRHCIHTHIRHFIILMDTIGSRVIGQGGNAMGRGPGRIVRGIDPLAVRIAALPSF